MFFAPTLPKQESLFEIEKKEEKREIHERDDYALAEFLGRKRQTNKESWRLSFPSLFFSLFPPFSALAGHRRHESVLEDCGIESVLRREVKAESVLSHDAQWSL